MDNTINQMPLKEGSANIELNFKIMKKIMPVPKELREYILMLYTYVLTL